MNSQSIRLLCLAAITLPVVAIGASTAGLSQPKSFEGAYKGSLECERLTAGISGVFRTPLSITVGSFRGTTTILALFDSDDTPPSPMTPAGTVDPDGVFRVGYTLYTSKYTVRGDYSGTLNAAGGTLTGTQVLTRETTGDGATGTCKGTFSQVELPRR